MIMDKQQWREFCKLRLRNADTYELMVSDALIISRLLALTEYRNAGSIFCYASRDREVDTDPIIENALNANKTIALPRIIGNGMMEARWISDLNQLQPGRFGIREPLAEAPIAPTKNIDMAIIPCLSCDMEGHRLGYGGGYYDRYLAHTTCYKVALCRERSLAMLLPTDETDIRMDFVITEKRTVVVC